MKTPLFLAVAASVAAGAGVPREASIDFDNDGVVDRSCVHNAIRLAVDDVLSHCAVESSNDPGAEQPEVVGKTSSTRSHRQATQDTEEEKSSSSPKGSTAFSPSPKILSSLDKLQLDLDRNRMMHRLAAHYFEFQNFWVLFVPSIVISTLSGILACLSDSAGLESWFPVEVKGVFSTLVGILSIVSVSFQAMNKELDYSHRAKEHEGVAMELRILYDKIKFEELVVLGQTTTQDNTSHPSDLSEMVKLFEEKYEQVMTGCTSPLPTAIYNAYELASSRMELYIYPPVLVTDHNSNEQLTKARTDWSSVMGIMNNEVFAAFGRSRWWPMRMPHAEPIVDAAFDSIYGLLRNDQEHLKPGGDFRTNFSVYRLLLEQHMGIQIANGRIDRDERIRQQSTSDEL